MIGEQEHTPSRGAPRRYLIGEGPVREAKICLTAYERLRRVTMKLMQKQINKILNSNY